MKSDNDHDSDFFPDEGLPALAIFTFYYRNEGWLRSKGYLKEDLKLKRAGKTIHENLVKESQIIENIVDVPNSATFDVLGDSEKLEIRDNLGPMNRKRVPVLVYDNQGTLFRKMELNLDKNTDISVLYRSFQRSLKYLEQDYLQPSNQQIEAITHDGVRLQDLTNLDFDAVKGFYII